VYLLNFDAHLFWQNCCMMRAGVLPYYNYLTPDTPMMYTPDFVVERNGFMIWDSGYRLGPTFLLAPLMAWFRFPALRILHVACGVTAAGFAYLTALRLLKSRVWALLAAAALVLNPFILSISMVDENVLVLGAVAGAFYFSLARGYSGWLAGLSFGVALGTRHILVMALPALYLPGLARWRLKETAWLTAGLLLASIPWIVMHASMYFGPTGNLFESFGSKPPIPYELFGHQFHLRAFLNWPISDHLMRDPYSAFPTLLAFPLTILRTFGALFVGAALVGLGKVGGLALRTRLAAILWVVPFMAVLMIQNNWVEPNKMGLFLVVMPPVALLGVAGLKRVFRPTGGKFRFSLKAIGAWAGISAALIAFQLGAGRLDFPLDRRPMEIMTHTVAQFVPASTFGPVVAETEHAEVDKQYLTSFHPLPDYSMAFSVPDVRLVTYRIAQVVREFCKPGFSERQTTFKDVGNSATAFPLAPPDQAGGDDRSHGPGGPFRGPHGVARGAQWNPEKGWEWPRADGEGPGPGSFAMRPEAEEPAAKMPALLREIREAGLNVLPLSKLLPDPMDKVEGVPEFYTCEPVRDFEKAAVRIDLSKPPVMNRNFLSSGKSEGAFLIEPGTLAVIRNILIPWEQMPVNIIVMASLEGAVYFAFPYPAFVQMEHLRDECYFRRFDAGFKPFADLLLPAGQPVYMRQFSSHEPRSFHGWQGVIRQDSVKLGKPFRTSY